MTLRAEDLPKAVRDRLGLTRQSGTEARQIGAPRKRIDPGGPVRCHACQVVFPQYPWKDGWEAHSNATGHSRCEVLLAREAS